MPQSKRLKEFCYSNGEVNNSVSNVIKKFPKIQPLSQDQLSVVQSMVNGKNTIVSMPTGSGKSIPPFIIPYVFDDLIGTSNSVLIYATPLIALNISISNQLKEFGIHHQVLDDSFVTYDPNSKILIGTPERLLIDSNQSFLRELNICSIVCDEIHLNLSWGITNKTKKSKKSFRPVLGRIGEFAIFGCNFLLMSATISKRNLSLIKRNILKLGNWHEILKSPERENLRYFLYLSKSTEEIQDVVLRNEDCEGSVLINVFSITTGFDVYCNLYKSLEERNLLLIDNNLPNIASNRRIAFVHSGIMTKRKEEIIKDLSSENPNIKYVVCTSALATGVHLNIRKLYSLGLFFRFTRR